MRNLYLGHAFLCTKNALAIVRSKTRDAQGFSMIELLVVIGMIGIILMAVIPNFAGIQQRQRIRAGTEIIAQDLRQIRERALSRGRRFEITRFNERTYQVVNPDGDTSNYYLGRTAGGNLSFGVSASYTGGVPPEANQGAAPADGFDFPGNLIFDNRGGAQRGVMYITDTRDNYAIGVNNLGKVKVYRYSNGTWD